MSQKIIANKKKYQRKKILSVAIIFFALLCIIILFAKLSIKNKNEELQLEIETGDFSSIQNILTHYGCKYIGQKNSTEKNFVLDIEAEFKYDLYNTDDTSNEKFYNNVINSIAKFLNYKSFRLIDTSKKEEIEIQVICDGNRIQTIYINGIEDYFVYMDSQISLKEYKEIKNVKLNIQSSELIDCIQNNWDSNTEFGTRETIFQDYYIYFDEGIEARQINGKIYNVIFTKKYAKSVVNGFTVGSESDIIKRELGTPSFQNEDGSIIGYKSDDVYIFFEKDQISVYRNTKETGFDSFFELVDEFLEDKYTLLEFMNELTDIWPDYEQYVYDTESVFLSYPNKGIDIKINYDNTNGIVLYNNIGISQEKASKYLENTEFVALLKVDNIYNAEVRRYENVRNFNTKCNDYEKEYEANDKRNKGKIYKYYAKMDTNNAIAGIYFIAQNDQYPNCELNESIYSYVWINDYCIAYSKYGKGIYYYDLKNQIKGSIITGDDNFEIKSYKNGILKYDNKELNVQY